MEELAASLTELELFAREMEVALGDDDHEAELEVARSLGLM